MLGVAGVPGPSSSRSVLMVLGVAGELAVDPLVVDPSQHENRASRSHRAGFGVPIGKWMFLGTPILQAWHPLVTPG